MYFMFEFFIRLIGFSLTFYYLLEYIVTSKVNTNTGLFLTFLICLVIMIFFKFYVLNNVKKCDICKQTVIDKFYQKYI
jgi:hypothetical protein